MTIPNPLTLTLALTLAIAAASCSATSTPGGQRAAKTTPAKTAPEFEADSALSYACMQCGFGPRVPGTPVHSQCGQWLAARLSSLCPSVTVQEASLTATGGSPIEARNIIAQFNPDSALRILLIAHWDSRPWADHDPDPSRHNEPVMGANDGASGVAVLLELARLMANEAPPIGVDILLTDAEDSGQNDDEGSWALGTQYWAANPHKHPYRPVFGILLDMVGAPGACFAREYYSMRYAQSVVTTVWTTAHAAGYGDYFPNVLGGAITDDHVFINRAGIKCIDIIDQRQDSDTGFFEQWHTTSDTPDRLDPATLKAVGQTLTNLIYLY